MPVGWHVSRWAPWSSKSVAGSAKLAAVGSTPMPSRLHTKYVLGLLYKEVDEGLEPL